MLFRLFFTFGFITNKIINLLNINCKAQMATKDVNTVLDFLKELRLNNNREWFNANKHRYLEAKAAFEELTSFLAKEIAVFDPAFRPDDPKKYIFRIYRDVRFSKNKSPYKEQFGAFLANGGRKSPYAGYYFHIEPGNTMAAGGIYCPAPSALKSIRTEVLFRGEYFQKILNKKSFKKHFGSLADLKLKRPPVGFPKDHPFIELAKYKSYIFSQVFSDEQVRGDGFMAEALAAFKAMKEINDFLNEAINLANEE